ncbi:MAG: hypothetical protein EKK55_25045 [Rhodocyclaceae bacterium]|nr:MAG: hypothetical protein EKK55_25045 [Rhodocyclaceae bacterium]
MSDPFEIPTSVLPGVTTKRGALDRSRPSADDAVRVTLKVDHPTFPQTITLTAKGTEGDTSAPLPDAVAEVPKVAEAIRLRKLAVTVVPAASPAPPPAPKPERAPPAPESEGDR